MSFHKPGFPNDRDNPDEEFESGDYYGSFYTQKKSRHHTGLLVVVAVLALVIGTASWAVNVLGLEFDIGQRGLQVMMQRNTPSQNLFRPNSQAQNEVGEALSEPMLEADVPQELPPTEAPELPAVEPQEQDHSLLVIGSSPASVENFASEAEGALSLQAIYEKAAPSVASISCVLSNGSSSGTGIILSDDGYLITNYHVIEKALQIWVLLDNEQTYNAVLVGGDETSDLAVLRIEAEGLQAAEFGDSDALRVGDAVVAIGDPLGFELRGTMTDGIISAINRDVNIDGRQMTMLQTNTALNSGNSGGPLINCYGQVIGINTMKMSNYSANATTIEGLGFAIPITTARPILDELIAHGYVAGRPAIGIEGQTMELGVQFFYHLPSGVVISHVEETSDAYEKGITTDDILVGFNDETISSLEDLVRAKNSCTAGETAILTIYRSGRYYQVPVTLMEQTAPGLY